MRRRFPLLLLLALATGLPLVAAAQVYKWTDANGTVHYADAPPANGADYKDVKVATHSSSDPASDRRAATARTDRDTADADDATQARHEPVQDTPENREKLCENLDANIKLLTSDHVVVTTDDQGHEQALSDQGREQQLAQARQRRDKFCGA